MLHAILAAALTVTPRSVATPMELSRRAAITETDAYARAEGNRKPMAVAIGRRIFAFDWPAQVMKVRVDGVGDDAVAALSLSAVKFHARLNLAAFDKEVAELIAASFATAAVEEVDVLATQPLELGEHPVVTGDLAQPTSRIVFAVTVRRHDLPALAAQLRAGRDVYVAPDFRRRLAS